ncbi:Hypothetical predicted protein [Lecanosticta acicola]|uniref:Guanine nucleotide-binding protein-like 3 N-terminal domain-containing protein n=1 Tax=Lecanosticta acicola TaxID=111012 RepID=A0AAI8YWT6_9PEZI|nr:Hypothetical predicted protein [Lecanosticta acicola]
MKVGKPKSKRVSVRLRHKIEKASSNKQRKQRKEAKKNPQWRSRLKKDPGIPNLFPYKDKVLAEIEESKRKKEEEQVRKREVARAQREGRKVKVGEEQEKVVENEDEELPDPEDMDDVEEDDDDEMEEDTDPMAALLASAQARAQKYQKEDEDEEDDEEDDEEFQGLDATKSKSAATTQQPTKKILPKQALEDPIKGVTALIERLEKTQEGIQQLLDYYQLPPLVTAGSDTTTRFLVDVARKRGRLSRGGVPNMHAAALTVLGDLNEERLKLPALQQLPPQTTNAATNKGEVQIVSQMAQPFRIEGLFGNSLQQGTEATEVEMETT